MTRRWFSVLVLCCLLLPASARADRLDEVIARLAPNAEQNMREAHVPGMAIAVVRGGRTVWAKGFGTRRAGADLPVTPDTVFQVGSTTKAFTVAIMATLVDTDDTDWDDPVSDLYPPFALYDPWVTREFLVHDLFAQHSGLPPYAGDLQLFIGYDRDHVLRALRDIPPVYSFRDKFSYVNNLFMMAGRVEEELTGKSWETLMQERILAPLGMTRSSADADGLAKAADGSELHRLVGGKAVPIRHDSILYTWPYVAGAAGGLNSTANDMARWIALQLGRGQAGGVRIFSEESADYMREPRTPIMMGEQHGAYCQGWMRTEMRKTDVIWHNGGTSGICSFVGFSPALDAGIVILTNLSDHQVADAVGFEFFDLLSGVDDADWIAEFRKEAALDGGAAAGEAPAEPALPGLAPGRYAGDYDNAVLGPLTVRENKDGLTIRFGEGGRCRVMARHETMHSFVGDWPELSPEDPAVHFDFQVDGEGVVTGVLLREYDDDGCALFTRYQ
ncbi:serine hydrolase [Pseudodesulfovibrio sp.]|uniref:serine hydrolase n=1 Tax=Pseudodesulfovibrio sp. TaxID=2035812 RepID=UPI002601F818|nr:serine hydrolase [Pseudodesulfovibrio sp.]MDD3312244.1 serine hydrolase [Pseudodesulfovibrio sp.]